MKHQSQPCHSHCPTFISPALCRTSSQVTSWGSSRTVMVGRNSGLFSPTSACSSTRLTRSASWGVLFLLEQRLLFKRCNDASRSVFGYRFRLCLQDDFPLASLPLLGYTVSTPEESDSIHKEYVFKLQFKSHVYFFRAESEYTFERYTTCFYQPEHYRTFHSLNVV